MVNCIAMVYVPPPTAEKTCQEHESQKSETLDVLRILNLSNMRDIGRQLQL